MRTIKGTKSIKAFKAVRSLDTLELDEVIYQTAVQAINAGDTWSMVLTLEDRGCVLVAQWQRPLEHDGAHSMPWK